MTTQNRKTVTINLVVGKDDDLLTWIARLPKGGRDTALRTVLRCGLELPQPTAPTPDYVRYLETEIQTLRDALARLPAVLKQPPAADHQRVTDLEQTVLQLRAGLNSLQRRLDAGALSSVQLDLPGGPEAAPQLSQTDRQQRETKLKKATW